MSRKNPAVEINWNASPEEIAAYVATLSKRQRLAMLKHIPATKSSTRQAQVEAQRVRTARAV